MKHEKILFALMVCGYYAALIGAVIFGGLRSGVMVILGCVCTGAAVQMMNVSEREEEERENSCAGCRHDLGGGMCSVNLEDECREGGGFEAKEET